MSAAELSSRSIIGEFYAKLEQDAGASWATRISNYFTSDQESETYKWLGQSPAMREWIGGRNPKGFTVNGITIVNKDYEATLEVLVSEMRRDKTGQIMTRVRELATRTNAHWAKLLTTLMIAGEAGLCYDGQYFFDTDHLEGDSGSQNNDLTANISTATAPTAAEMEAALLAMIQAIVGFKDNQGEPMNEGAKSFLAIVPVPFMTAAAAALGSQIIVDGSTTRTNNIITMGNIGGFSIEMAVNPRLTWTDRFAMFRTDCETHALIRQEEVPVSIEAIAEGSELEFKEKKHHYGVSATRNVGYGYWQRAALMTFT
jgi:phage major head subunit gpT-like protein